MKDLLMIFGPCAASLLLILLGMFLHSCSIRRRLAALLTRLSRGERVQVEDFEFIDGARPEQLQYPFSRLDGQLIAQARELRREELAVTLTKPLQAVFDNYEYRIDGCFEGLDARGTPFAIRREGYVYIRCGMRRGHFQPCIMEVRTGSRPVLG